MAFIPISPKFQPKSFLIGKNSLKIPLLEWVEMKYYKFPCFLHPAGKRKMRSLFLFPLIPSVVLSGYPHFWKVVTEQVKQVWTDEELYLNAFFPQRDLFSTYPWT